MPDIPEFHYEPGELAVEEGFFNKLAVESQGSLPPGVESRVDLDGPVVRAILQEADPEDHNEQLPIYPDDKKSA